MLAKLKKKQCFELERFASVKTGKTKINHLKILPVLIYGHE